MTSEASQVARNVIARKAVDCVPCDGDPLLVDDPGTRHSTTEHDGTKIAAVRKQLAVLATEVFTDRVVARGPAVPDDDVLGVAGDEGVDVTRVVRIHLPCH